METSIAFVWIPASDYDDGRSQHAAEIARLGQAIPWPPSRNDPCWCGHEMKYKRCCFTAPPDRLSVKASDLREDSDA